MANDPNVNPSPNQKPSSKPRSGNENDILYAQDVTFNMMNVAPVSATFQIFQHEAEKKILEMAQKYADFRFCTFIIRPESSEVQCIVWINKKSPDISDRSLIDNTNVYVNAAIDHDSNLMAQFKQMYAETVGDGHRVRYIQSKDKPEFVGIRVNVNKIFMRFFDSSGIAYKKKMVELKVLPESTSPRECSIRLTIGRAPGHEDYLFTITKTRMNLHADEPPTPKPSFR